MNKNLLFQISKVLYLQKHIEFKFEWLKHDIIIICLALSNITF